MSQPDQNRAHGPLFEQPDGVGPLADERTVPLDGLKPQNDPWADSSAHRPSAAEEGTLPLVDLYGPNGNQAGASPYGQNWNPTPIQQPASGGGPAPYRTVMQPPHQPQAWGPGYYAPPEHPQAITVLVLALVSFAVPILSFIAWYMGGKAKSEIQRGAPFPYSGNLKTGHIIGKVIGILTIVGVSLYVLFIIVYAIFMVSIFASI